jgi:hypothetical protein
LRVVAEFAENTLSFCSIKVAVAAQALDVNQGTRVLAQLELKFILKVILAGAQVSRNSSAQRPPYAIQRHRPPTANQGRLGAAGIFQKKLRNQSASRWWQREHIAGAVLTSEKRGLAIAEDANRFFEPRSVLWRDLVFERVDSEGRQW